MIKTYKSTFVEPGVYNAVVQKVELKDNDFFKIDEDESAFNCPHTLTITFQLEGAGEFQQPYINPSQDYGLFGDLCALAEHQFGEDPSEDMDEQLLVGTECTVLIELVKNKKNDKEYRNVTKASALGTDPANPNATKEETEKKSK